MMNLWWWSHRNGKCKSIVVSSLWEFSQLSFSSYSAYGRGMIPKHKFLDLLRIVGLERLRFITSHPKFMSLGVVDDVADTPAACENFHFPFQSGFNDILVAMGRGGHTWEKYLHIMDRIHTRLPDASIMVDVIVGYPGEPKNIPKRLLTSWKKLCLIPSTLRFTRPDLPYPRSYGVTSLRII